jgi:hypothetical protein
MGRVIGDKWRHRRFPGNRQGDMPFPYERRCMDNPCKKQELLMRYKRKILTIQLKEGAIENESIRRIVSNG